MKDAASWILYWAGVAFIVACILLALQSCGPDMRDVLCEEPQVSGEAAFIIGGEPSTDRRATLRVSSPLGRCGATAVGPHTLLSAGHCGDIDQAMFEGRSVPIVDSLVHPDFDFPHADLQLGYTDEVLPEPYAKMPNEEFSCVSLVAQGYGIGSMGVLSEREVTAFVRFGGIIYATEASCAGDSGGPLWATKGDGSYVQVGVVSFGYGNAGVCSGDGGYADLITYGQWVEENIR